MPALKLRQQVGRAIGHDNIGVDPRHYVVSFQGQTQERNLLPRRRARAEHVAAGKLVPVSVGIRL
jgi:hypothetical protein